VPTRDAPPPEAVAAARAALRDTTGRRPPGPLALLLEAKARSDRRDYGGKHDVLRRLLTSRPGEFLVDSDDGRGILGLTHTPTGFRIHLPKDALPPAAPPPLNRGQLASR
jgi:hypothetical protein